MQKKALFNANKGDLIWKQPITLLGFRKTEERREEAEAQRTGVSDHCVNLLMFSSQSSNITLYRYQTKWVVH